MFKELLEMIPEYPYSYWLDSMHHTDGAIDGIAIISRYPIVDIKSIKLSNSSVDKNGRSCLRATISHPLKKLKIYNTHMTNERKSQVKQALDILKFIDQENVDNYPQILLGDFNIKYSFQAPAKIFEGGIEQAKGHCRLTDAWKEINKDEEGSTYPSWDPRQRHDRIYCRKISKPLLCQISGYAKNHKKWPSNHCTLFADFMISN